MIAVQGVGPPRIVEPLTKMSATVTTPLDADLDARGAAPHRGRSAQVEQVLAARRTRFRFEPNLKVASIRQAEGTQVRLVEHRAPREMVKRYSEQMRAGALFPAIVVNDRFEVVDGNTRVAAVVKNGVDTIPGYICDDLSALEARSLSVELNQTHGLSMTEDELRGFVASAVTEGRIPDTRAYARMTGVSARQLALWVAAAQFRIRAQLCGLPVEQTSTLSDGSQAALQYCRLKSVFLSCTSLALAARIPTGQLRKLISRANISPSEAEALHAIEDERFSRSSDIAAIAQGFHPRRRRGPHAGAYITGLLRFNTDDMLDVPSEKREEALATMDRLYCRLGTVLVEAKKRWAAPVGALQAHPTSVLATDEGQSNG